MNLHEVFLAAQMMGSKSEKFRHIETLTVEEDGISMLKRTEEPDGTPYNFKKILARLTVPKADVTSSGRININSTCSIGWRTDMVSSSSDTVSTIKAEINCGLIDGYALLAKTETERVAPNIKSETMFMEFESIHTIAAFTDPSSVHLPIGTKFEIYAV